MTKRSLLFAAIVSLTFVGAGCLDAASPADDDAARVRGAGGAQSPVPLDIDPLWYEHAVDGAEGHDHSDSAHHQNLSTPNFEILGYNPLITDYHGHSSGGYFCGDTNERDGRRLSIVHSFVSDVVLIITDVTDAHNPKKLGELVMSNTQVYDVALSPDQRYALLASSPLDGGPDSLPAPLWTPKAEFRDACTGETRPVDGPEAGLPYASGVILVNIQNPLNPLIEDFRPLPAGGAHSVRVHDMDGTPMVLTTALNPGLGYAALFEIGESPGGGKLVPQSVYQATSELIQQGRGPQSTYVHDGFIQKHPATGDWLLYLAHGTHGLVIANINDPMMPEFITHWADWGSRLGSDVYASHFIHQALPVPELWDGRHYTILGEECGGHPVGVPTCVTTILDTTDPANPEFVGSWTLPTEVVWTGTYQFSPHYIALHNKTLFISNYHGGVWAVDISSREAMETMPTIGVFIPARESPKPWPGYSGGSTILQALFADIEIHSTPFILDLDGFEDGTFVVWDGSSGLYTVAFDPSRPAPAPAAWPFPYHETTADA